MDTRSVQNKMTMMRMKLACLRQATSNHEAISMVLACGRCLPRCMIMPCWPLFAGRRSRKAASSARLKMLLDRKRPDGRALDKGGRTQRARASSASSSCFPREGGAESENRQHSLFFGFWNEQRASSASSLLVCRWPTTRKVMLRMLTLRTICHPECETDDADDACCSCSKAEGKRC